MGYYLLGFEPEAGDRDGAQPRRQGRGVPAEGHGARPRPAQHPRRPADPRGSCWRPPSARRSWIAACPSALAAYALRDAAAGKVRVLIAAPRGRLDPAPERRLRAVGRGRQGGGEPRLRGHRRGRGRVGGVHRRGGRGPGRLQPAPRRGGRRGAARQRRAHREGRARLRGRARDLGPRPRRLRRPGAPSARPWISSSRVGASPALLELAGRDPGPSRAERRSRSSSRSRRTGRALLRAPVEPRPPGKDGTRVARMEIAAGLLPPGRLRRPGGGLASTGSRWRS